MGLSWPKISNQVEGAVTHTIKMDCLETAQVGDLVRISETDDNLVIVATDNLVGTPIVGMIKSKLTSTYCEVILRGVIERNVPRGRVWLGSDGNFSINPPVSNYQQSLGFSFGNQKLMLDPDITITKKT